MFYLVIYLILINLIALFMYRIDKTKAKSQTWRIKESTLLLLSLLGGGIGSILGMELFRHKTKKLKFKLGVPLLTILSVIILWLMVKEFNL